MWSQIIYSNYREKANFFWTHPEVMTEEDPAGCESKEPGGKGIAEMAFRDTAPMKQRTNGAARLLTNKNGMF